MTYYQIFIATNNTSKLGIISSLIKEATRGECMIVSPKDTDYTKDVKETGDLKKRAKDKAMAAYDYFGKKYDFYIGVDDGICIEKENRTYEESQEATARILAEDGIYEGDDISIVRAFCSISKEGNIVESSAKVPFVFLGNKNDIKMQDNKYPLNQVVAYKGTDKSVAQINDDEVQRFDMYYMLSSIKEITQGF